MPESSPPPTVLATFHVIPGKEPEFEALRARHWPTLRKLDLVTAEPAVLYRGADDQGRVFYVEIFTWKDARAVERAHQHPDVLAIWEPLEGLCEARDGRPSMEFPHVERVAP